MPGRGGAWRATSSVSVTTKYASSWNCCSLPGVVAIRCPPSWSPQPIGGEVDESAEAGGGDQLPEGEIGVEHVDADEEAGSREMAAALRAAR